MPAVSKQLLSMLDGLRIERAQLTERLKVLSEREKTIRGWLAEERAEQEKLDKLPPEFPPAGGTPEQIPEAFWAGFGAIGGLMGGKRATKPPISN